MTALEQRPDATVAEYREAANQMLTAAGRAALMESQVDILEGKQRTLGRYREAIERIVEALEASGIGDAVISLGAGSRMSDGPRTDASVGPAGGPGGHGTVAPAFARAILTAQEDLRRDIARAMHDGPAQSLTNIVLQAEIAHRLMARDPKAAAAEVRELVKMVQHALDATKSFIFDVRPMVLDDLGLVPTLRRAALDRGARAGVPIHFESIGTDRRLAADVESGLFRILDDALVGYLTTHPPEVHIEIDWNNDKVRALVRSEWPDDPALAAPGTESTAPAPTQGRSRFGRRRDEKPAEVPPALAAMIREQQDDTAAVAQAAADAIASARELPATTWRDIEHRAGTLGVDVALAAQGRALQVVVTIGAAAAS
jgi:hypothetical protein